MSEYLIQESTLIALADSIRAKNGGSNALTLDEMMSAIAALQVGNDTSDATADASHILVGKTAYIASGKVDGAMTDNGAASQVLTKPGDAYDIPEGYHNGEGSVSVKMTDNGAVTQTITENGAVVIPEGYHNGEGRFTIDVETGTDTADATATASDILSGKTAYGANGKITGTIAAKTSSDLTADGATVTVPAGHYAESASKAVATAEQATPAITVSTAGLITASATQDAGYVASGTKSGTKQLTTQAAKTVTPSTSSQTAVAKGVFTTGAVTVGAMPTATQATPAITVSTAGLITASATQTAGYVSAGTKSATKQLTVQAAKTYTPTTSNQTISSGRYLTGTQTIKGDSNLKAENIASGVTIFGVTGTLSGGPYTACEVLYYTPTSSVSTFTVYHNLGVIPNGFHIVYLNLPTGAYANTYAGSFYDEQIVSSQGAFGIHLLWNDYKMIANENEGMWIDSLSEHATSSTFTLSNINSCTLTSGHTYEIFLYRR